MERRIAQGSVQTIVERGAASSYVIEKGAALTLVLWVQRLDTTVRVALVGRGASAQIVGFVRPTGDTKIYLRTLQIHEAPETTSSLLVKSIVSDSAMFSYEGSIRVAPAAQKADAYQRNENLLLSPSAHAQSKPSLEILANDVRCTHGATIGTIDPDELWYLTSRGIDLPSAKQLIVKGFFESAIGTISDIIVQEKVRRQIWQSLS